MEVVFFVVSSSDDKEVVSITPAGFNAVFFFGVIFLDAVLSDAAIFEVVFFVVSSSDEKEVVSLTPAGFDAVFFFGVVFLDAVLSDGLFLEVVLFGGSSTDDKDKLESSSSVVFFLAAVFFLLARVVLDAVVFVFFFAFVDLFNVSRLCLISASLVSSLILFNVSANFFLVFAASLVTCLSLCFKSFCCIVVHAS